MTPGEQTSEFKLAQWVFWLGTALDAAALILETLEKAGTIPAGGKLQLVLAVVGTLSALVAKLGYARSRTLLKLAELQPQASEVIKATVPFVKQTAELIHPSEPSKPD